MTDDEKREAKATIRKVRDKLKITKVVCTRSVKGRSGDHFVGFSAAWDSVQDDGGRGLAETMDDSEVAASGMTLKEAKVAAYLLGMQADQTAFQNAAAGSLLTQAEAEHACKAIKHNYGRLMSSLLGE